MKEIYAFIYNENDGSLVKKYDYTDLILAINNVIDNNILEENKWNIICDIEFPPKKCLYSKEKKSFLFFSEVDRKIKEQIISTIKNVY